MSYSKILLFLVLSLLVGCSEKSSEIISPNNEPVSSDPIIPLAIGNYWQYRVVNNNHDSVSTLKYQITDKVISSNETWYTQKELFKNSVSYLCQKSTGIYLKEEDLFEKLICKYPAEEGESWSDSVYTVDNNNKQKLKSVTKYKLSSKLTYAKVPAGEFTCYLYSIQFYDLENEEFTFRKGMYHPGIGKVFESYEKMLLNNPTNLIISSIELITYKVN